MSDVGKIVLGAALAICSTIASDFVKNYFVKRNMTKGIKVSLSDELAEIQSIIQNMQEVWEKTNSLIQSYIDDLRHCTATYDEVRPNLYLIKDSDLRNEIRTFYRDLKNTISENYKKAGSLSMDKDKIDEQKDIANKFINFKDRASRLAEQL